MRRFLAGISVLLILPTFAFAQARGEVESIGFGSLYRPNCFIPMLIRVQADKSGTYQIRVVQDDLDRDREIFAQTVSLTGAEESKGAEQKFWMYFIPQPTDNGLPDTTRGGTLRELQQELKVFLCDEKGKELVQLPITQTITNIEGAPAGAIMTQSRGVRLILAVSDSAAQPIWRDYQNALGTMEDVVFVTLRSTDLPEDVRGYDMIDGIVWLGAPLPDPRKPSDEKRYQAIQAYVRGGGHLVVCQAAQRDATASIADMLPVEVQAVSPRNDLEPLKTLATERQRELEQANKTEQKQPTARELQNQLNNDGKLRRRLVDWNDPVGPFMFARGKLKSGAVADEMMLKWNADGTDASPYIARIGYGLGCVTWVAHDLADPSITRAAKSGWPYVWDRVLDYRNDLIVKTDDTNEKLLQKYSAMSATDMGISLLGSMYLKAKTQVLVSIAVVFFIGYWLIAGPGVYFYLVTRSRPQLSWFLFALSAVVATLLTVAVVRLVLRGAPEMSHITIVRGAAGMPQISVTRLGLYIPRDGAQQIALTEVSPRHTSYLVGYPQHPKHSQGSIDFPAQEQYIIPIHDNTEDGPVQVTVPFRSTAKQFQARRIGPAGGIVEGTARLRYLDGVWRLEGLLTNATGVRLRNVYLAFNLTGGSDDDQVLYLPAWDPSVTLNLSDFNTRDVKFIGDRNGPTSGQPEDNIRLRGPIGKAGTINGWSEYWLEPLRTSSSTAKIGEQPYSDLTRALPIMSLFSRLPPLFNDPDVKKKERVDILRRGARDLDASNVVAAGGMLVLAEADNQGSNPLPFPLEVNGTKVEGKGSLYYQFAIPMERIGAPPATQPATTAQPAVTTRAEAATWPQ